MGFKALVSRYRRCRAGYAIIPMPESQHDRVILADKKIIIRTNTTI